METSVLFFPHFMDFTNIENGKGAGGPAQVRVPQHPVWGLWRNVTPMWLREEYFHSSWKRVRCWSGNSTWKARVNIIMVSVESKYWPPFLWDNLFCRKLSYQLGQSPGLMKWFLYHDQNYPAWQFLYSLLVTVLSRQVQHRRIIFYVVSNYYV